MLAHTWLQKRGRCTHLGGSEWWQANGGLYIGVLAVGKELQELVHPSQRAVGRHALHHRQVENLAENKKLIVTERLLQNASGAGRHMTIFNIVYI